MATAKPRMHEIDWEVDSPEIGRVCTLLGIKPGNGMVLDFMDMDVEGIFKGTTTTGKIAKAWLERKLARVSEIVA